MKINDLMTSDSRIISYSCFKDKFCFPVSFLEFCGVTSAIRSAIRSLELSLPGEKILENVLLKLKSSNKPSHCLLLGRFYVYSCKNKNIRPSSIEYVNPVRNNLKIEKHVSIITGTQNAFQQKWHKILQSL